MLNLRKTILWSRSDNHLEPQIISQTRFDANNFLFKKYYMRQWYNRYVWKMNGYKWSQSSTLATATLHLCCLALRSLVLFRPQCSRSFELVSFSRPLKCHKIQGTLTKQRNKHSTGIVRVYWIILYIKMPEICGIFIHEIVSWNELFVSVALLN